MRRAKGWLALVVLLALVCGAYPFSSSPVDLSRVPRVAARRSDLAVSLRLADKIPAGALKVTESGIHSAADIQRLRAAGYQAFLVGEHLMKSGDPAQALRALLP